MGKRARGAGGGRRETGGGIALSFSFSGFGRRTNIGHEEAGSIHGVRLLVDLSPEGTNHARRDWRVCVGESKVEGREVEGHHRSDGARQIMA